MARPDFVNHLQYAFLPMWLVSLVLIVAIGVVPVGWPLTDELVSDPGLGAGASGCGSMRGSSGKTSG